MKDATDFRSIDRVIEKLLKSELKLAKTKKKLNDAETLKEFYEQDQASFDKTLEEIISTKKSLPFTLSDMLRGKCLFETVEDINNCVD